MLRRPKNTEEKVINITATMKGNLTFNDPVNLRLSGNFEGKLETKGTLIIGEEANLQVTTIRGEDIKILGKVKGDIISSSCIELFPPCSVIGSIQAPILIVREGAGLKGHCDISAAEEKKSKKHSRRKK